MIYEKEKLECVLDTKTCSPSKERGYEKRV